MQTSSGAKAPRLPYNHGEPIWRCRYDVVAVVVFLIAGMILWVGMPSRTHAFAVDLPSTDLNEMLSELEPADQIRHTLSPKADGSIEWNGETVTTAELREQIYHGITQTIEPQIIFIPDAEASYDLSVRVLYLVKRSGVAKLCFGGLEEHRHFYPGPAAYRLSSSLVNIEVDYIEPLPDPPQCSNPEAYLASIWP